MLTNQYKENFIIRGFSLIELSIVLVIIGLLTASVTSGSSLIQSVKVRDVVREVNDFKNVIYLFKIHNNRSLPGDINDDGMIGGILTGNDCKSVYYTQSYGADPVSTRFGKEYSGYSISPLAGPFVDLYLAGLLDFRPKLDATTLSELPKTSDNSSNFRNFFLYKQNIPRLRSIPYYIQFVTIKDLNITYTPSYCYNMKNGLYLKFAEVTSNTLSPRGTAKISEKIDMKIDDGNYQKGNFRARCSNSRADGIYFSYQSAKNNRYPCFEYLYRIMD